MKHAEIVSQFLLAQKSAQELGFTLSITGTGSVTFELRRSKVQKGTLSGFSTKADTIDEINAFLHGYKIAERT